MMTENSQKSPLRERLEHFGDGHSASGWRDGKVDYVGKLGLTADDVPELLAIAREWAEPMEWPEDESDFSVWAPVHAWRGLAQLRAVEAIPVLLGMMDWLDAHNDDWFLEEFPFVFAWIGPAAIEPVAAHLADDGHETFSRVAAISGLRELVKRYPETREQVIQNFCNCLSRFEQTDETINASLISGLLKLKAMNAAELIERAYAADRVDIMVNGNWNTVRKELGVEGLGLVPEELASRRMFPFLPQIPVEAVEPSPLPNTHNLQQYASEFMPASTKVGRNAPCPCGSGKKYKKCCGRG